MSLKRPLRARVSKEEYQFLLRLREQKPAHNPPKPSVSPGDRLADAFAAVMGSWRFIIIQSLFLMLWVLFNVAARTQHWDPYPFILLNLMLSFQAAYAAPIIMMSQNRQAAIDRAEARHDYEVNLKSELEIELMQDKINLLREQEIAELKTLLLQQRQQIERLEAFLVSQQNREKENLAPTEEGS
ncbi:DUF1003 domain-containing protein [Oscillatoria sp. FACHB-1406]|uniref:DUF1003 domain-containing protein n=1 Tax=Oscillatoria sp. FACHB-1406 TaxID=2692846 RepID=UPI00168976E9|nr:DUF1003 domain-containing protein [Oscillatoria sp. FACHB-1406]MBD2580394.1 DUF1003 domain-containing protein [Oscillatoria sp. FACHB-1406]